MELVTDMDRVHSIFESYPECQEIVRDRVRKDGSDLTGVNARILWSVKPVFDLDDRQLNLLWYDYVNFINVSICSSQIKKST